MKRQYLGITVIIAVVFVACFGSIVMAQEGQAPNLVVDPMKGTAGTKIMFYGSGFVPEEQVRIIMTFQDVPYAFGEVGTGGLVQVNEYGAFILKPRGGIPKVLLEPGVYTIEATGDKGSYATYPLEVLPKE